MNSATAKFLICVRQAIDSGYSISPDELPIEAGLDGEEAINWVASTWIDPFLLNLFVCTSEGRREEVVASFHSDNGVVIRSAGPWDTLGEAKSALGFAPEGWTDV